MKWAHLHNHHPGDVEHHKYPDISLKAVVILTSVTRDLISV